MKEQEGDEFNMGSH